MSEYSNGLVFSGVTSAWQKRLLPRVLFLVGAVYAARRLFDSGTDRPGAIDTGERRPLDQVLNRRLRTVTHNYDPARERTAVGEHGTAQFAEALARLKAEHSLSGAPGIGNGQKAPREGSEAPSRRLL